VIGVSALYLRHRHLPPELAPPAWVTVFLWAATLVIVALMGYYALLTLRQL
jgi:hypothetical protein